MVKINQNGVRYEPMVSVHFSPKSAKQSEYLLLIIFKKKVRLLILTFDTLKSGLLKLPFRAEVPFFEGVRILPTEAMGLRKHGIKFK